MTSRKSPAAAEALGESIPFHFDGVDYELVPTSEWPFEAVEEFENGRVAAFLALVLGAEQYAAFKATKPKLGRVNEFVTELQKAVGIAGN